MTNEFGTYDCEVKDDAPSFSATASTAAETVDATESAIPEGYVGGDDV